AFTRSIGGRPEISIETGSGTKKYRFASLSILFRFSAYNASAGTSMSFRLRPKERTNSRRAAVRIPRRRRAWRDHAPGSSIPERRVRMGPVGLQEDHGFACAVLAREHRLPHRDRLVHVLGAVDAGALRLAVLAEGLRVALAHVGLTGREQLLRPFVMEGNPVALVEHLVVFDPGPVEALLDLVVGLRQDRLVLRPDRIVEDEGQAAAVRLRV